MRIDRAGQIWERMGLVLLILSTSQNKHGEITHDTIVLASWIDGDDWLIGGHLDEFEVSSWETCNLSMRLA